MWRQKISSLLSVGRILRFHFFLSGVVLWHVFEYLHVLRAFDSGQNETFPIGNQCGHIRWECEKSTSLCLHGKVTCDWCGMLSYDEVSEYSYVEATISYIFNKDGSVIMLLTS